MAVIDTIRSDFRSFETDTSYSGMVASKVEEIRKALADQGLDASALDASGHSTLEIMEARIREATARAHLVEARDRLYRIENRQYAEGDNVFFDLEWIITDLKLLRENLEAADADASALDETGQSSSEAIEARLQQRIIAYAQENLATLEKNPDNTIWDHSTRDNVAENIRLTVSLIGKDLSALDPSGNSTAEAMEERLAQLKSNLHFKYAQNAFRQLEEYLSQGDVIFLPQGAYYLLKQTLEALNRAGSNLSTLDPSANPVLAAMRKQLAQMESDEHLNVVQDKFFFLQERFLLKSAQELYGLSYYGETFNSSVGGHVEGILNRLHLDGRDLSILDPTGNSSVRVMGEKLGQKIKVKRAQIRYEEFKNPAADHFGYGMVALRSDLAKAGQDASALDPSGLSSAFEMEIRISKVIRDEERRAAGYEARGTELRSTLKIDEGFDHRVITAARDEFPALDAGEPSVEEMESRLSSVIQNAYIDAARDLFTYLEKDAETPNMTGNVGTYVSDAIRCYLNLAKSDFSALDPTGRPGPEHSKAIEQRLANAAKRHDITGARTNLRLLETANASFGLEKIDSFVSRMRAEFKAAGLDASILDPQGIATAQEMEKRIDAAAERLRSLVRSYG